MKVVAFVISFVVFLAGLYLFVLAFQATGWEIVCFIGGIIGVAIAFAIPIHLLKRITP